MYKTIGTNFFKIITTTTIFSGILLSAVIPNLMVGSQTENITNNTHLLKNKAKTIAKPEQIIGGWTKEGFENYLNFLSNNQSLINSQTKTIEINNQKFIDNLTDNEGLKTKIKEGLVNGYEWKLKAGNTINDSVVLQLVGRGNFEIEILTFDKQWFFKDENNNYPKWSTPLTTESTEFQVNENSFKNNPAINHLTIPNLLFGDRSPFNPSKNEWFKVENNQLIGDYKKLGINIFQAIKSDFFNNTIITEIAKGTPFNCDVIFKWKNSDTFDNKLKKYGLSSSSPVGDLIKILGNQEFSNSIIMEIVFEVEFVNGGKRSFWLKLETFPSFDLNLSTDKATNQIDNVKLFLNAEEIKQINFIEEPLQLNVKSYSYFDGQEVIGSSRTKFLRDLGIKYQPDSTQEPFVFDAKWKQNLENKILKKYYSLTEVENPLPNDLWGTNSNGLPSYNRGNYTNNLIETIINQYGFFNQNTLMQYYQGLWNDLKKELTNLSSTGIYGFRVTKDVDGREVITCRNIKQWQLTPPTSDTPDTSEKPDFVLPPEYQIVFDKITQIYKQITLNKELTTDMMGTNQWINGFQIPQPVFKKIDGSNYLDFSLSILKDINDPAVPVADSNLNFIWQNIVSLKDLPLIKNNFIGENIKEGKETFILLRDKILIDVSDSSGGIYKDKYLIFDNLEKDESFPTLVELLQTKYGTIKEVILPDWVGYVVGLSVSIIFLISLFTVFVYMKLKKPPKDILDLKIVKKIK